MWQFDVAGTDERFITIDGHCEAMSGDIGYEESDDGFENSCGR